MWLFIIFFFFVYLLGDVIIVPEQFAHGVMNLQESVAVAFEFQGPIWSLPETVPLSRLFPEYSVERPMP